MLAVDPILEFHPGVGQLAGVLGAMDEPAQQCRAAGEEEKTDGKSKSYMNRREARAAARVWQAGRMEGAKPGLR